MYAFRFFHYANDMAKRVEVLKDYLVEMDAVCALIDLEYMISAIIRELKGEGGDCDLDDFMDISKEIMSANDEDEVNEIIRNRLNVKVERDEFCYWKMFPKK